MRKRKKHGGRKTDENERKKSSEMEKVRKGGREATRRCRMEEK